MCSGKPITWVKEDWGQYYLQKKFTIGAYINGTLKFFSTYWDTWYVDNSGIRHQAGKYWSDPRK